MRRAELMYTHKVLTRGARRKGDRRAQGSAMREGIGAEPGADGGISARVAVLAVRAAISPSQEAGHGSAATPGLAIRRQAIDDLSRKAQSNIVAGCETFMPAKIQQSRRVAPSRLGDRVMHVAAREADIRQHVVVKVGKQFDIAPMVPNEHKPFGPTQDPRPPHGLSPRLWHRHRGALRLEACRRVLLRSVGGLFEQPSNPRDDRKS
jgi:hypothetical protein